MGKKFDLLGDHLLLVKRKTTQCFVVDDRGRRSKVSVDHGCRKFGRCTVDIGCSNHRDSALCGLLLQICMHPSIHPYIFRPFHLVKVMVVLLLFL